MQRAFPSDEIFFTDKQLCRRWQCSQMKLWRLRKKGVLESIKIGGIGVNLTPAPATVCSRRETDEDYEGVITRSGTLRVVKCPHDLQLIVQSLGGGRWRNKSYHRTRYSLIRRYGPLLIGVTIAD